MLNAVFKGLYRGYGVYWHPGRGYGDETNDYCDTAAEYRSKIDARIAAEEANRPPHLLYWDCLSEEDRRKWRRLCQTTELSASELAYTNRTIA